jgi:hypothetical protein
MPKTYKTHDEWLAKFKEHLAAKPAKTKPAPEVSQMPLAPGPVRQYKRYGEQ